MTNQGKIKTLNIIKEAFLFILNNFKTYLVMSLFPIFIHLMEQHLTAYLSFNYTNMSALITGFVIIYIVTFYVSIRYAINIHKFVITNIEPERYFSNMWNSKILWFGIYSIIFGLAGLIIGFVWGFTLVLSVIPLFGKVIIFFIMFSILFWFVMARFSLILPSVAVGDEVSLFSFGKKTKGARLTILIQLLVIFIPTFLIFLILKVINDLVLQNYYFELLYTSLTTYAMLAWLITSLSFTYKAWKEL